ncbi:CBS domain-containing protein [Accumulibacter sp.]|jgi:magnesium transporter|uniref:magnesium transporter MgtE N-terminal domain-containing protein n=1 Tax=Accumulibacter sp. TaxID=2053492 RepID=UPI002626C8B2|nr:CBS domain-containing protein [Accumulibacter sp.]HRD94308.1 CBS domain-containing protein [Accumulibacter sp.]HRF74629.1 CBS domain-containing protein [Accumulibacter sp.]
MLFLASFLGQAVRGTTDELIGDLDDLIVRVGDDRYPPITGLVIRDRRRLFFVPASQLQSFNGVIRLVSSTVNLRPFLRRDGEILLAKDVLDHQIIDISGRRIVRVSDVQLADVERSYRLVGVDVSPQALLRRLGPRALAPRIIGRQVIDWQEAQYLASAAPVQLKVSYDRLSEMHPVDLARIVDALSYRESAEIVAGLDDETAAETLEEVSDERVADLLEGMDRERAADILEEMAPGSAADALEDLDKELADQILASMEPAEAADVKESLAYAEGSAGRIMRTDFVRVREGATVGDALALLRALFEVPDPLLAIYVVAAPRASDADSVAWSENEHPAELQGIVRLRTLVIANLATPLAELMDRDVPTISAEDRAEDATRVLAEYKLLAVPVLDKAQRLIGIVTVDDALTVLMPEIWQRRREPAF